MMSVYRGAGLTGGRKGEGVVGDGRDLNWEKFKSNGTGNQMAGGEPLRLDPAKRHQRSPSLPAHFSDFCFR